MRLPDGALLRRLWLTATKSEPWSLLVPLVVAQWCATLLFVRAVTHNGWLFYHGGDQTWYYTSAWMLGRGDLPETAIGYAWSFVLAPLTWLTGPNFLGGLPVILVAQVLLLAPVGTVAIYAAGSRLGGRVVGYLAAAIWALGPFVAIPMFEASYHDRFTGQFVPQVLGLTGLGDLPATIALVLAAVFLLRTLDEGRLADVVACGLAAGFAVGIKPSNALFLPAPFVALLAARRWRELVALGAALAPAGLTLAIWKARGLGNVPLLSAPPPRRLASGLESLTTDAWPLARLPDSVRLDWGHLVENWNDLQQFFFDARLLQWVPLAGLVAVTRVSRVRALFLLTWLAAYILIKASSPVTRVEDGGFWRLLMPAFPAFCLLLAAVPLLWPRSGVGLVERFPAARGRAGSAVPAVAAAAVVLGLVPLVLVSAVQVERPARAAKFFIENIYLPVSDQIDLDVRTDERGIQRLSWTAPPTHGTDVFFRVFRSPYRQQAFQGNPPQPGDPTLPWGKEGIRCLPLDLAPNDCRVEMTQIATTRQRRYAEGLGAGHWTYRIGMASNYVNDPTRGDVLLLSPPVSVDLG